MTVADTRVVCVKPTVSNITFEPSFGQLDSAPPTFMAMYDWSDTHPDISGSTRFDDPVNCTIPTLDYVRTGQWASSLCTYAAQGSLGGFGPARLNGIMPDPATGTSPNGQTTLHLFINSTSGGNDFDRLKEANATLEPVQSTGPWARLQMDNVSISVSLCFFNPNPSQYKVTAESQSDGWDSAVQWDPNTKTYSSTAVQAMLNLLNFSVPAEGRGLLNLHTPDNWTAAEDVIAYKQETWPFTWGSLLRVSRYSNLGPNDVTQTSVFSELSPNGDGVHRTLAAIVQNGFQNTLNPALTIQAFWTILMQQVYYDFAPEFGISTSAALLSSTSARIPIQWGAFAVVLGLLAVHFGLVLLALVLFLRTEMSLLGNSWQAVSQVVSTDTADIVHHAATSTDKELMESAKASGIDNDMIRIAKCENSGRVQARAVRGLGDRA